MSTETTGERPRRMWVPIRLSPVQGVELFADGTFRLGEATFQQRVGLAGHTVAGGSVDKEPGLSRPLLLRLPLCEVRLLYHEGQWYQSDDVPPTAAHVGATPPEVVPAVPAAPDPIVDSVN